MKSLKGCFALAGGPRYGADPLVRLYSADFPGMAFVKHCSLALPDAAANAWTGRDLCLGSMKTAGPYILATQLLTKRQQARLRPVDQAEIVCLCTKVRRISLLHLAVCRGSSAMLQTLLPILKSAHQRPVYTGKQPPLNGMPWQDVCGQAGLPLGLFE